MGGNLIKIMLIPAVGGRELGTISPVQGKKIDIYSLSCGTGHHLASPLHLGNIERHLRHIWEHYAEPARKG